MHTYRVFMEARGCYQIPSFIMYLLYIKYTHIHTRICNESSHGSQRLYQMYYCSPYYFLRQTRCLRTDSLADQRVSGTFLPLLPLFQSYRLVVPCQAFMRMLAGITLKSSCLQPSTPPAQTVILIYKYMTYKQSEKNLSKRAWDVAQMAECLPEFSPQHS